MTLNLRRFKVTERYVTTVQMYWQTTLWKHSSAPTSRCTTCMWEERAVPSGADMATSTSIHSSQTDACPASDQRDHDWWRQRQSSRLTLRSLAVNCKLRRSTTSTAPYIHTRTAPMLCWHGPTDASTTVTQAYNYMYTQQDALVSVKRKCTLRRSINELLN